MNELEDITYNVKGDLIRLIKDYTGHTDKDVWCNLSDMTQKCISRIKNDGKTSSWTVNTYPETIIKVRIHVDKRDNFLNKDSKPIYNVRIKPSNSSKWVRFTHKQVMEHITEEILLGDE